MESRKLLLLTGQAGKISGIIYFIGGILMLLNIFLEGFVNYAALCLMIGRALTPFILIGLYVFQIKEMGKLGLIGFIFSMIGMATEADLGWLFFLFGLFLMAIANGMSEKVNPFSVFLWLVGAFATLALSKTPYVSFIFLALMVAGIGRYWLGADLNKKLELELADE